MHILTILFLFFINIYKIFYHFNGLVLGIIHELVSAFESCMGIIPFCYEAVSVFNSLILLKI